MIEKQLNLLADGLPSLHTELDSNVYPVALDEIRQQVLKSIKSQHKSLGLTPNFDLPEGVILKANRSLLKRAVDHLLNNSLKPKHQVKHIFIQVDQKSHAPNKIRIIFADDGIGLTPDVEARILRGPVRQIGEDGISHGFMNAKPSGIRHRTCLRPGESLAPDHIARTPAGDRAPPPRRSLY